ncbi:cytochrome C biogenesis DsbD-like protein [Flavobacterium sp. 9]|jgi:sulfite exporter TauE/SafE|uniref:urease accessory protein UreH domain-containing protein n=1 Tax=Flavobacterium sp. 9 TaxID=2035198 RepID=UPI000C17547B|nr:sulfite exporter TauE/SafE family protein [Flavobacterium sp. 9]PIF33138.1 cytochrome C biogenesis DsbD-like protein [Flavobacterium sp. 9]
MDTTLTTLVLSAITISCLHTASGPDHYLPFIVLSRSRKWSLAKTIWWTTICGLGHILSSVLLGLIGVLVGWQLSKLSMFQDIRGNVSGWCLLLFGAVYLVWGLRSAYLNKPHKHFEVYNDEDIYVYEHKHGEVVAPQSRVKITPWILFVIFVMGPSEPLVPLLFYSGVRRSPLEIIVLIAVFAIFTVLTMLVMVLLGRYGYSFFKTDKLERYVHAIGGAVVTICGIGMVFLGW